MEGQREGGGVKDRGRNHITTKATHSPWDKGEVTLNLFKEQGIIYLFMA